MQPSSPRGRRASVLVPSLIATLIWPPLGIGGAIAAMMSGMLYDAPGSEDNPWIAVLIAGIVALPVLCGVSFLASIQTLIKEWRASADRTRGWIWAGLPLLAVALAAVGWVGIDVVCGGSLPC